MPSKLTLLLAFAIGAAGATSPHIAPLKPDAQCHVNTTTSQLVGANTGNAFNDIVTLVGAEGVTTDNVPSIRQITIRSGSLIDGIAFTYSQGGSGQLVTTISHGTSITAPAPINTTFILKENESIVSVAGVSGGGRVQQIKFEILDSSTGTRRIVGPLGTGTGTAFNVTGPIIGISGFAVDTNTDVGHLNGALGGLYGLTFITSAGTSCSGGSVTIEICSSVNSGCVDLPVVSDSCVNLTGGLSFLNKEISFATIPGGFICTFFQDFGCDGTDSEVVLTQGPWSFLSVPGLSGATNFNDLTSSFTCSPL